MDKTKVYNITMFERGKIRMLGFKERITKIVSKKHNFDPRKKER